jgi:hypothetical protein
MKMQEVRNEIWLFGLYFWVSRRNQRFADEIWELFLGTEEKKTQHSQMKLVNFSRVLQRRNLVNTQTKFGNLSSTTKRRKLGTRRWNGVLILTRRRLVNSRDEIFDLVLGTEERKPGTMMVSWNSDRTGTVHSYRDSRNTERQNLLLLMWM